jgi:hypothetical protein
MPKTKYGQTELLSRFAKVELQKVRLETEAEKLRGLLSEGSLEPENRKPAEHDPNSVYIATHEPRKKKPQPAAKAAKPEAPHGPGEEPKERQRVYKAGPFALFYQLNEGGLNKDDEVWYYKDFKEIVGPVSSYNMDKMVYFKTIHDDTKVAFKSVDKFVRYKKIKSIVDEEKGDAPKE